MSPEPSDLSAPIRLDFTNACLWQGPQRLPLRPKTFAVLRCLMAYPGQLVSKAALLDAVWPETTVHDVALMICIRELRQALGDNPRAPRFIETVHRRGYRFVGDLPVTVPASYSPPSATRSAIPPVGRQEELRRLHPGPAGHTGAMARAWHACSSSGHIDRPRYGAVCIPYTASCRNCSCTGKAWNYRCRCCPKTPWLPTSPAACLACRRSTGWRA